MRLVCILFSIPLALFSSGNALASEYSRETLRDHREEVLSDERYQESLPWDGTTGAGSGREAEGREPGEIVALRKALRHGGVLAQIAQVIFYLMLAAAIVLLVVWAIRALSERRIALGARAADRDRGAGDRGRVDPLADPEAGGRIDWLARAERLAARGNFSDAIHALLLGAIDHLAGRAPSAPRKSLTSRELSNRFSLEGETRKAFRRLVHSVELSLFGEEPLGRADFQACRESLQLVLERGAA